MGTGDGEHPDASSDGRYTALLLAGGSGRRMGAPKSMLPWGDGRLLDHLIARLTPGPAEVLVAVRPGQHPLPLRGEAAALHPTVVTDEPVARRPGSGESAGPLAGLSAGLAAARSPRVVAVAVDLPLVEPAVLSLLAAALDAPSRGAIGGDGRVDIALPVIGGRMQPLLAAYRRDTVLPAARALLAEGRRALLALTDVLSVRRLPEESFLALDPTLDSFRNVNTPEDLRLARERWSQRGGVT